MSSRSRAALSVADSQLISMSAVPRTTVRVTDIRLLPVEVLAETRKETENSHMSAPYLISIHDEGLAWRANLEAEERRMESMLRRARVGMSVYVCDRSPAPGYPIEPRGVYVARYLSPKGNYVLNCIDRRGRHVAQVVVADPERWVEFHRTAVATLEELDPGLTLI